MKKTLLSFLFLVGLSTISYNSYGQDYFQKIVDAIIVKSGTSLKSIDFHQSTTFMDMPFTNEYPEAVNYNGKRLLLISDVFKQRLNSYTINDWAALLQLSHEIVHHTKNHEFPISIDDERISDEFAGKVMNSYGATRKQLTEALETIAESNHSLNTKIDISERLVALVEGWQSASVISIGGADDSGDNGGLRQVEDDTAMTAEKVLRKSLDALGGIDKIKRIDKLYQKQEMVMDMGIAITTIKTEQFFLNSATLLNKMTSITDGVSNSAQALIKDGDVYTRLTDSENWTLTPGQSMNMISNSTNYIQEYQLLEKLYKVTYLGTEMVDDKQYYTLETPEEVITETSEAQTTEKKKYYYDVDTGLLTYVKWDTNMPGVTADNWVHYLDYRRVSGIFYSHKQEMTSEMDINGTEMNVQTVTIYPVIEINPDFDESMFNVN
jgi:hypothetical protein